LSGPLGRAARFLLCKLVASAILSNQIKKCDLRICSLIITVTVLRPALFYLEDGDSRFLRKFGNEFPEYTASHPERNCEVRRRAIPSKLSGRSVLSMELPRAEAVLTILAVHERIVDAR
jgi:hypothetical protein